MDIKYMLACIFMSMEPAKHEQAAIFRRKMSGLRMFSSILGVQSTEKSTLGSFTPQTGKNFLHFSIARENKKEKIKNIKKMESH